MRIKTPLDALMADQRLRWQGGERPLVEQYLKREPDLSSDREAVLELIYHEVLLREGSGERPGLEEYLDRFPHLADDLRVQFEVHGVLSTRQPGQTQGGRPGEDEPPNLDAYEVREKLGHGGVGVVYRAWHKALKRPVALKVLRDWTDADEEGLKRFRAEAEAVARVQHPNVVQIYEVGEHKGCVYLALELVEGGSLEQHLAGQPQPPAGSAALIETLARAMHHVHGRGIVHCDLKPANILLQKDERGRTHPKDEGGRMKDEKKQSSDSSFILHPSSFLPKITDFGFARRVDEEMAGRSGRILGTLLYLAPEQAGGPTRAIGPAADVYALGAILYECLTGRPPFLGENVIELLRQVQLHEPVPPRRLQPNVPRDLETICLKCLAKEPGRRYATAEALANDLRRFQEGRPILARPASIPERTWRWCRRNPLPAALAGLLTAAILLGFGGVTAALFEARQERDDKEEARNEAATRANELALKNDELEAALGRANFLLARRAWEEGDVARAEESLEGIPPRLRFFEWRLLRGLCRLQESSWPSHQNGGLRVAISPDGSRVASVGYDNRLIVRDGKTGQVLHEQTLNKDNGFFLATALVFSPDNRRLATAGYDKVVTLWGPDAEKIETTRSGFAGPILAVAYRDDGKKVLTLCERGLQNQPLGTNEPLPNIDLIEWDARTGKGLTTRPVPRAVAGPQGVLSPDGRWAALVSLATAELNPGVVWVWDTVTGGTLKKLEGHVGRIHALAFSRDGGLLASAADDKTVRLWNTLQGRELQTLRGHADLVLALAFSPDGSLLASAGKDRLIKIWDVRTGKEISTLRGHVGTIWGLAFRPDDQRLLSIGDEGTVLTWGNLHSPGIKTYQNVKGMVLGMDLSHDGTLLASAHGRGGLRFMDLARGREMKWLPGTFSHVSFSPDAKRFAAAAWPWMGNEAEGAGVWEVATGKEVLSLPGVTAPITFSPDGNLLAGVAKDKEADYSVVLILDAATGEVRQRLTGTGGPITGLAFAARGNRLAACSRDTAKVWDVSSGQEIRTLDTAKAATQTLALSPDGRRLATAGGSEPIVRVWDVDNGTLVLTLKGHRDTVWMAAFSPDGRRLATVSADRTARFWDAATGQLLLTLPGPSLPLRAVVFSGDGNHLAAGGGLPSTLGEVVVWDGKPIEPGKSEGPKP
jgi:WD40 repeat protein/serine/threonine protein kinase